MQWLIDQLSAMSPVEVYGTLVGVLLLCGLGVPIPEDISLVAAGYFAHRGVLNVHTAFAACFLAVIAGDSLAFYLGRLFGRRILATAFARRYFSIRRQRRVRAYFRKLGSKVIFVARFLPGLRFSIFFSAGMLHVRPAIFLFYDSLAAIISVPLLVYAAWYFGDSIDRVIGYARQTQHGLLIVIAVVILFVVFKAWRRRRQKRQPEVETPDEGAPAGTPGL